MSGCDYLDHLCICTYIIDHFDPSVRTIDLVSLMLRVNFIHKWWDLQFKVDTEQEFFFFLRNKFYLLSEFLPEIC